jgi:hypothetical protein
MSLASGTGSSGMTNDVLTAILKHLDDMDKKL